MENLPAFFLTVVQISLVGSVVAGLLWLFERRASSILRAAWRHALWWAVAATLVLPLIFAAGGLALATVGEPQPVFPSDLAAPFHAGGLAASQPIMPQTISDGLAAAIPDGTPLATGTWNLAGILYAAAVCWLALATFGVVLLLVWYVATSYRLHQSEVAPDDRSAMRFSRMRQLLPGCRRARLLVSSVIGSPAVFGVIRPKVCLPVGLSECLSNAELDHVLRHELTHIGRRDQALSLVLQAVRLLHWFNPAVWLACAHIDRLRELACDEAVVSQLDAEGRRNYGDTLITLASQPRFAFNFPVPGMSRSVEDIQRRIIMIAKPVARRGLGLGLFLAALVLVGCVAVVGNALPVFPSEVRDGGKSIPTDAAQVIGSWKAVDFVYNREEFVPGEPKSSPAELWIKQIGFGSDGTVFAKFASGGLRPSSLYLGEAKLIDMNGRDIPWFLSRAGGKEYLAMAWAQPVAGGNITRDWYYIFERIDTVDLKGFRPQPLAPADAPTVFEVDPAVLGTWKVVDFIPNSTTYKPGRTSELTKSGMTRLTFRANGTAKADFAANFSNRQAGSGDISWSKGVLIGPDPAMTMPYRIEGTGDQQTLWLTWRNGDVVFGGEKPWFYVLVRE